MAKWSLFVERADEEGRVVFIDTGRVVETDDPHAAVMAAQARDGRSHAAHPYRAKWFKRFLRAIFHAG